MNPTLHFHQLVDLPAVPSLSSAVHSSYDLPIRIHYWLLYKDYRLYVILVREHFAIRWNILDVYFCGIRLGVQQPFLQCGIDQIGEQAIGPGKPGPCERMRIIGMKALVHISGIGISCFQHIDHRQHFLITGGG